MKHLLANLAIGVALAVGAMTTLFSVVLALKGDADSLIYAFLWGIVGIPTLYVTLVAISRRRTLPPAP